MSIYKRLRRHHALHRTKFHHSLIQAKAAASQGRLTPSQVEKQLHNSFKQTMHYRQIRNVLPKPSLGAASFLTSTDPEGHIITLQSQQHINNACFQEGISRFSQTNDTPFMQPPLLSDFGYLGIGHATQEVLKGRYSHPALDADTQSFIDALHVPVSPPPISNHIDTDDYINLWRKNGRLLNLFPSFPQNQLWFTDHHHYHGHSPPLDHLQSMAMNRKLPPFLLPGNRTNKPKPLQNKVA